MSKALSFWFSSCSSYNYHRDVAFLYKQAFGSIFQAFLHMLLDPASSHSHRYTNTNQPAALPRGLEYHFTRTSSELEVLNSKPYLLRASSFVTSSARLLISHPIFLSVLPVLDHQLFFLFSCYYDSYETPGFVFFFFTFLTL